MCTGLEVLAAVGTAASAASSVKGLASGKPKSGAAASTAALDATTEENKRAKAVQKAQRKPTETFLTGGQGLTGTASGVTLG